MDQVATNDRNGAIGESDCDLRKVAKGGKCRYLSTIILKRILTASQTVTHTGNSLLAFWMDVVDRHRGVPVFFSDLSRAQTLRAGSFRRSSEMVTRREDPSICLICVMEPASDALNDRMTLKPDETM